MTYSLIFYLCMGGVLSQKSGLRCDRPPSPRTSYKVGNLGGAEGVDDAHSCLDFCGLVIRVYGGAAFARGLETPHLGLDAAAGEISGTAFL